MTNATSLLRAVWQARLHGEAVPSIGYWFWLAGALLLSLCLPSQLLNGQSFWTLTPKGVGQGMLSATAFLALSLLIAVLARRPQGVRLATAIAVAGACYGTAYAFLTLRPGLVYGWGDFAVAAAVGSVLAPGAYVSFGFVRWLAASGLWIAVALVVLSGARVGVLEGPQRITIQSALQPLALRVYRSLVQTEDGGGGAIEPYEDGFLLVTGDGAFYALDRDHDALTARKLALALPPDPDTGAMHPDDIAFVRGHTRRVTDLLVDRASSPGLIYVAYQRWDAQSRCVSLRLTRTPIAAATSHRTAAVWVTVFETKPCVPAFKGFDWLEAGGRLSKVGDRILITVGGFGQVSTTGAVQQTSDSPYGKVWFIDREGRAEIFTLGHRNPQGLLVDADGNVWLTEHGPQGGDELNFLKPGRNYGYPLVTYGTDYGRYSWSLGPDSRDHGTFEEPVFAFPPWQGISNLIRIESGRFHSWKGDLLIASLNAGSLFRVRLRDTRAVYVEQIPIGLRIRDLAEGSDGRLALWTDEGAVIAVGRAAGAVDGSAVFARCRSCHETSGDASTSLRLRGIVGRAVAGVDGYPYSEPLRRLGGVWTEERLDAFLADPDHYAPGSAMRAGRVPDAAERQALLAFLRDYR